jgi:ribosomal protein S18 acetylase RimI-like enzyme
MRRVGLEVAVENERALGLYTSIGFRPVTTEDYYALSFAS